MATTEDANVLAAVTSLPELAGDEEANALFDALPVAQLASMWCALQRISRRDQTGSVWAAKVYFDHLPHDQPDRALDLVLEVLATERDKPTVMQLNDKLMLSLMFVHGTEVIDRIEMAARDNAKLRWLLGGIQFGTGKPFERRVEAIADRAAWELDDAARHRPQHPLDCETMPVPALARAWVEQYSKSDRDRDDNFFALMDFERDLREEDPDRAIDLIVEILKIETNPVLLSMLAAGPLEDVISMKTIDRIEREAKANRRFRDLLGGVWYFRAPDELKARLDALIGDNRW
ncbi:DUF6869 domain-containing protein [Bradyrhizobium sp.]|uniref:DUF6869 domain-containing protein n=1 Tax=Bradyrhizobium sp. TaxID=376 RepID=UPI001DE6C624|nr:hypothetical protein [Bradyrhizobium sp.]MBI5321612.1 hypothetical protein [Bradyrhizobium sp.]